jgi:hypothetical protein
MSQAVDELWAVARQTPHVDAEALARAVEAAAAEEPLDYRTRLLIRDSVAALESHWGHARLNGWLEHSANRDRIEYTLSSSFEKNEIAFPSLGRRVVDPIRAETVLEALRALSIRVSRPSRMVIGGAIAVILDGHLARHTEDIDVVDEVPSELRGQHEFLEEIARRYGLRLTHFQSHYLPSGWDARLRSIGAFGKLQVMAVDSCDVFVGKLFSIREKDRDDLSALKAKLEKDVLAQRVRESTTSFRAEPKLLEAATQNWFVLYGEPLPA